MTRDKIFEILVGIFRDVLDDDSIVLRDNTVAGDVEGWDSLSHIRLVITVEKRFKIRFNASEVAALRNVGDMADLVQSKL